MRNWYEIYCIFFKVNDTIMICLFIHSILSIQVKEAHINGLDSSRFVTYVVLKIDSVKSTTLAIQGLGPYWNEEFYL